MGSLEVDFLVDLLVALSPGSAGMEPACQKHLTMLMAFIHACLSGRTIRLVGGRQQTQSESFLFPPHVKNNPSLTWEGGPRFDANRTSVYMWPKPQSQD